MLKHLQFYDFHPQITVRLLENQAPDNFALDGVEKVNPDDLAEGGNRHENDITGINTFRKLCKAFQARPYRDATFLLDKPAKRARCQGAHLALIRGNAWEPEMPEGEHLFCEGERVRLMCGILKNGVCDFLIGHKITPFFDYVKMI